MNSSQPRSSRRKYVIWLVVLLVITGLILAHGFMGGGMMVGHHYDRPATFQSNGERIYFMGASASGDPVSIKGRDAMPGMMNAGCVDCHGANREGGRLMHRFWVKVPALTPQALFDKKSLKSDGHDHGDHAAYTLDTLRRAITQGLNPDGKPLDAAMPRWSMSPKDLDDLVKYLADPVVNRR